MLFGLILIGVILFLVWKLRRHNENNNAGEPGTLHTEPESVLERQPAVVSARIVRRTG
jgi:hypothetical protein